ncbi:hypothetical protein F7731_25680 [Cytobacillus depressus]|uniref:Uncharacterized protein n=1 Tax=Cytobacillus depressus TaxID=1602942 RepID=A0A6L3UZE5_9BACI|nr:hypothetical protein [Cytobacillus depressus]KAB2328346.1 hypothetical protein F7731_25680 [Cytobacillus depressus]
MLVFHRTEGINLGDPNVLLTAIITISAGQGKISEYQQEIKRINEKIDEQNKELNEIDLKWFSQKAF